MFHKSVRLAVASLVGASSMALAVQAPSAHADQLQDQAKKMACRVFNTLPVDKQMKTVEQALNGIGQGKNVGTLKLGLGLVHLGCLGAGRARNVGEVINGIQRDLNHSRRAGALNPHHPANKNRPPKLPSLGTPKESDVENNLIDAGKDLQNRLSHIGRHTEHRRHEPGTLPVPLPSYNDLLDIINAGH